MVRLIVLLVLALVGLGTAAQFDGGPSTEERRDVYLRQLRNDDRVPQQIRADYTHRNTAMAAAGLLWVGLAGAMYSREIRSALSRGKKSEPARRPDPA